MGARNFDRVASLYRFAERLTMGHTLQRARVAHLEHIADARRILILGEGDGRFLHELLQVNRVCQVTVVESSPVMAQLAAQRLGDSAARVQFVIEDAADFAARHTESPDFDALVTLFFLDCFEGQELVLLVRKLAARLVVGGTWLYADFAWPEGSVKRFLARLWIGLLYLVFRTLTGIRARQLADPLPLLQVNGLDVATSTASLSGALVSTALVKHRTPA